MDKQEIYRYLSAKNIWHEIVEHKAVYNMVEAAEIDLPHPETSAKNLFLHDDKKRNYYLLTVKSNSRVDLKKFRQDNGTRRLSFASAAELHTILKLIPGAVTPLGLLNDEEHKVQFFIDEFFLHQPGIIAVHPNDNTATVWLKTTDLIEIVTRHGNPVKIMKS
ncbi:prolyl-tRNA synthetase associated domain-containing protein [Lactobacillus sp. ESL0731]|uniref:prolyl-tRNA synthetase associated domain-containing protein n=1 Tax=unclassified Lactobacillus TaxID=2620435 RepID=UPI0023F9D0A8|nr:MULTISPECIES: prolyl-tRNA synthetase associated domain-containing protein [unclassified Lactobacillus]WEV51486.1 prolyl-tRNA synthetase associated domain-containing protein [Lactobacillus sp. ESL0700]WEV62615.1 prolyl-tRNA synthetase associated domain-containing protein [Lactobacillus sp. ESL0731]